MARFCVGKVVLEVSPSLAFQSGSEAFLSPTNVFQTSFPLTANDEVRRAGRSAYLRAHPEFFKQRFWCEGVPSIKELSLPPLLNSRAIRIKRY